MLGVGNLLCGHHLVPPESADITFPQPQLAPLHPSPHSQPPISPNASSPSQGMPHPSSYDDKHLLSLTLQAVESQQFDAAHSAVESDSFHALMHRYTFIPISSVKHMPRSCQPLLAQVLSSELKYARLKGIWGFTRLHIFAKLVLSTPPNQKKKGRIQLHSTLRHQLLKWQAGDLHDLWSTSTSRSKPPYGTSSTSHPNSTRALLLAREGHYSKAIQALRSLGIHTPDDLAALAELIKQHPTHPLPESVNNPPPPFTVEEAQVLANIKHFPKGSSPGDSQLQMQHLYDAICGSKAPTSLDCLSTLTKWINYLLSGKADPRISTWLCGALLQP